MRQPARAVDPRRAGRTGGARGAAAVRPPQPELRRGGVPGLTPTSENLAVEICRRLKRGLDLDVSRRDGRSWKRSASPRRRATSLKWKAMKSSKASSQGHAAAERGPREPGAGDPRDPGQTRRRPRPRRPAAHSRARGPGPQVPHQRLPDRRPQGGERGALRGEVRRDGGGEGHRILQPVRTPPAAVFRQDPRGLPAQIESGRPEQDPAHRGRFRAPAADPGAADAAGGADHPGSAWTRWAWA